MTDYRHCKEFSRAQAGQGLPSIEPGMPQPAGTGMPRRQFLLGSLGVGLTVYGAMALARPEIFIEGIAEAAEGPANPILISVFIPGGWDGLNVLAPTGDGNYQTWRPNIALPVNTAHRWSEDDRLQWHPDILPLKTLHEEGKVSVLPALGYTSPNQSHFTSRHYYEVGSLNVMTPTGWMGRYLDIYGSSNNPLQGLALSTVLNPALATDVNPVAAVSQPSSYTFNAPGVRSDRQAGLFSSFQSMGSGSEVNNALSYARTAVRDTATLREQLAPYGTITSPVTYPNTGFSNQLKSLAAMIAGNLPLRCVTVNAPGGYDTHEGQASALSSGLKQTSEALLAFQRDLEARSVANRVMVLVWSEFGRRPKENGTLGTDHGSAACGFLIGSRAKGAMIGEWPGLTSLDRTGNLKNTSDFRGIYCSLLEQWMGVDAADIIPGAASLPRTSLLK